MTQDLMIYISANELIPAAVNNSDQKTTMEMEMIIKSNISSDTTVKYLLETYPQILQIFLKMKLLCVGCPAEGFHTLAEVAHEYQLDLNDFIENINNAIRDVTPAE